MRIYPRREVPPNSQFRHWRVLYELDGPFENRNRWFQCECDCGYIGSVRIDNLVNGKSTNCIECSKKYDHLYKQVPGCKRSVTDSHAWECWTNMNNLVTTRGIPVCKEWREFEPFLHFYLKSTGLTLHDIFKGRVERSYYHAERIDKEIGWSPENTTFIRFITERARHIPTFQYWNKLRILELLDDDVLEYKLFINCFGTKRGDMLLVRHDTTQPHSKLNSYWQQRYVRRKH